MAPALSAGLLVGVSTAPAGNPQPLMAPHKAAVCTLFHAPMISGLFCQPWLIPASAIKSAGRGVYLLLLHCPSPLLATVRVLSTPPLT